MLFSTLYLCTFCIDRTATAEGQEMKQVLSTFSKLEQSRFEAFRKASFPGDAIGTYVAHCLINEQHRSISTGGKSTTSERGGNGEALVATNTTSTASIVSNSTRLRYLRPTTTTATTTTSAISKRRKKKPILSDVVATGQSGDITVVVSTLAKAYAQRLVLAARKYSIERRNKHQIPVNDENSNDDEEEEEVEDIAISPEDILKAYADREVRGLDPGFFLQARGTNNSGSSNSGCTNVNLLLTENDQRYNLNRSVVLSAQDEYYNNKNNDNDNDNDNDNMEIDIDDEHNNNNNNVDTTNDNNVIADKDKGDNDEKNNNDGDDDDDDDDDDDPVDESVKLFSLLVNQINARQNGGITALSSSDYDDIIGIDSDIIADSNKSNNLDDNVDENNKDKKEGISNINTDSNVTAIEVVAVPMDTSSDGTTTTNTNTTSNNSTDDATTSATTNTTTIDTKSDDDNAE